MIVLEFIIQVIFGLLLQGFGAVIVWVFTGCRRPLKEVWLDDEGRNTIVGTVMLAVIVVVVAVVKGWSE